MTQAYRFALDPSPTQERALRSHAGAARFAWNWALHRCKERYAAERKWYSAAELHKLWNGAKKADPALAWWGENSKCCYQEAFRNLDRALGDFSKSRKGQRKGKKLARPGTAIGIDLGVKVLITGADDAGNVITVPGPRPLRAGLRRLRRAHRAHSRKRPGSAGRRKSAARLARLHARIASVRGDALHKATTMLAARYETVVAEDLNVAGMTRNRKLARAIADQGFGQVRRMLGYKTAWHGGTLVTAGRFYPSSKKCSGCGTVKAKLALSERTYQCDACGLAEDRDVNAARNLLKLAASGAESLNARGGAVRPRTARRAPPNLEPGTPPGGKTGTAARQRAAAARAPLSTQPQREAVPWSP